MSYLETTMPFLHRQLHPNQYVPTAKTRKSQHKNSLLLGRAIHELMPVWILWNPISFLNPFLCSVENSLGSQHPSPNVKTLCNFEPQIWPEIITSRDAESTCLKVQRRHLMWQFGAFFCGRFLAGKDYITWWMPPANSCTFYKMLPFCSAVVISHSLYTTFRPEDLPCKCHFPLLSLLYKRHRPRIVFLENCSCPCHTKSLVQSRPVSELSWEGGSLKHTSLCAKDSQWPRLRHTLHREIITYMHFILKLLLFAGEELGTQRWGGDSKKPLLFFSEFRWFSPRKTANFSLNFWLVKICEKPSFRM